MRPIDYFDRGARLAPERAFLVGDDISLSFAEAGRLIDDIARGLVAGGFAPGDSIAVYSPNHPLAVACVFAAMRVGGAWVPVNVRNSAESNAEYMAYVRTRWLFFHRDVEAQARVVMAALPDLKGAICFGGEADGCPTLEAFRAAGRGTALPDCSDPFGAPQQVFSRWPTGGTTGPSKGVEMTNANIVAMFELGLTHYVGERRDDVVHLAVAPITHAAGVIIGIFAAVGGTTVVHPGFDAGRVLEAIERHRVTHIFLPPTAYYALLDHPDVARYDHSSLRQVLIAAAPVSPDKFRRGVEVFGPVICQCYGQAEAPMLVSMLAPEVVAAAAAGDHPQRLHSCGQVTSCTRVAILDDAGNELPRGERGEICCRGPLVTLGYYERPEATAEARQFGWHHTGDVGYLDEDDFLYIVDRKKDMIITGGFNVFATEVEAPLLAQPEVLECAVIGVPDERWGESIKAIVVLKEGVTIEPAALIDRVKAKLGGVKTPKSLEIWAEIPKTAVGKTDKKVIRNQFWGDRERAVN
ncbi:MAG: AMP-binding protein [Gammaproteobacteria bacterium]|nr:AMP-binding protein [Gammaproteobacteria bacterium]MCP5199859.1 AMP-binding protein [Gammaproteobacteria bacterium]